jgi:hypothetical protein
VLTAPTPKRPPTPEGSNQFDGSGGRSVVVSASLSGRDGEGWVLRPEPRDVALPPEAPLLSPRPALPSAVSLVTTAPAGERAGAEVTVEPGGVVVGDDGRVVVVDRPVPPEDGMDVLVVEGPGPVVGVDVDVVVVPASSSAGTVVVVEDGSVGVVVVVVVESGVGSVFSHETKRLTRFIIEHERLRLD